MPGTIDWIQAWTSVITTTGLIVAGGWAYFRLRKERAHCPQIEFDIACKLFGPESNYYIAEFRVKVLNTGLIRQKFSSIKLRVRSIDDKDELNYFMAHRLNFPNKIFIEEVLPVKKEGDSYFVEPGVHQDFVYISKIPISCKYLSVHANFIYEFSSGKHTTERLIRVSDLHADK